MTRLMGRGVSSGTAVGRAVVAVREARDVRYRLAASGVDRERQRLRTARDRSRQQLEEISARVDRTLGASQAAIFAAQILMLDDPLVVARADALIRSERINADWAVQRAIAEVHEVFAREGDQWLSERVGDLADVSGRLMRNLRPGRDPLVDLVHEIEPPLIVVADELPPSVAAQLDWDRVRGLLLDVGGPTHHTVILARSLGVPAVVGLGGASRMVGPGQLLAIDGDSGDAVIEPDAEIIERFTQRDHRAAAVLHALDELRAYPAHTADGVRVSLDANLEIAEEVGRVRDVGAEGIGLYRSEFLLDMSPECGVDEEAQLAVYRTLLEAMAPLPVTIRTFDVGEDRRGAASIHRDRFGLRGIRAGLQHDERFRTQIRALLRSAEFGTLRILLPFVTTADDVRQARAIIAEMARDTGVTSAVPVGAMIEVPAAALTADHLAAAADFLSVGTNDLIQYTLAVDRTDERLAGHYEPHAPAVLRLLRLVANAGRRAGCPLSVCGEMAADPVLVTLLVGLGFRRFSMTAAAIPILKGALRVIDSRDAARIARRAVRARAAADVAALLAPAADAISAGLARAGRPVAGAVPRSDE